MGGRIPEGAVLATLCMLDLSDKRQTYVLVNELILRITDIAVIRNINVSLR